MHDGIQEAGGETRLLPDRHGLSEMLALNPGTEGHALRAVDLLWDKLLHPLRGFLSRPGKSLRSSIVELACRLAAPEGDRPLTPVERRACVAAGRIVEMLHAGALIIDDIEDDSVVRRDGAALHRELGVPVALNAGNWLYFWALHELRGLGLPVEQELYLVRTCHEILVHAHFGQAIDLGIRVDELPQDRVFDACMAAIELKTGALVSLAMRLGGSAALACPARLATLDSLGRRFGVALQMFEDLGNFGKPEGVSSYHPDKRHEDLRLRRPSWLWAFASRAQSPDEYRELIASVAELPDEARLNAWARATGARDAARASASRYLADAREAARAAFAQTHPAAFADLAALFDRLEMAYD